MSAILCVGFTAAQDKKDAPKKDDRFNGHGTASMSAMIYVDGVLKNTYTLVSMATERPACLR